MKIVHVNRLCGMRCLCVCMQMISIWLRSFYLSLNSFCLLLCVITSWLLLLLRRHHHLLLCMFCVCPRLRGSFCVYMHNRRSITTTHSRLPSHNVCTEKLNCVYTTYNVIQSIDQMSKQANQLNEKATNNLKKSGRMYNERRKRESNNVGKRVRIISQCKFKSL